MAIRYTLGQVPQLSLDQVASLPVGDLATLSQEARFAKKHLEKSITWLNAALERRYGERAKQARAQQGKETGLVHLDDQGFDVAFDLPKRIVWDQAGLALAERCIDEDLGLEPALFITRKLGVAERSYASAPPAVRALLEPARTVKIAKPVITLDQEEG